MRVIIITIRFSYKNKILDNFFNDRLSSDFLCYTNSMLRPNKENHLEEFDT